MFKSARLKLTVWYLMISILISLAFSFLVYRVSATEVERLDRIQRFRIQQNFLIIPDTADLVNDAKHRILLTLGVIDVTIWATAATLGYFLAGRTLRPIQTMVDDQNRFISDASHELKTPLTSLKSAFEVYLRSPRHSGLESQKIMQESITEVDKLRDLSESLLTLAQYQVPNGHTPIAEVNLQEVILEAIRKTKALAVAKKIEIQNNSGDYFIWGNEYGLVDLMVILLDNAIKYSPENSRVWVGAEKTDGLVVLSVTDSGIGIAKKDQPHIFDRFYRADSARSSGGYGLGLAIAKKIVEAHHGSISVSSELSRGTTFSVKFQSHLLNSKNT